jgi:putative ABC transport system substrate-binding protein
VGVVLSLGVKAMRRRDFIAGFAGVAGAWPLAVYAQQSERVRRIGMLENAVEGDRDSQSMIEAFRQRVGELGWSEGRNVQIDVLWSAGDLDRLHVNAARLVGSKPDVIVGRSTPVVAALRQASTTVPIVFVNANDPIRLGFVQSLARPGGNITGFISWDSQMGGKWLEILKEIAPGVARVGLIYSPQTYTGQQDESLSAAAHTLAVTLTKLPFNEPADIEHSIEDFSREPSSGLVVLPDIRTVLHSDLIVRLTARYRVPAIYPFRPFVASGALAYYGTNTHQQYRQAAEYVDRILKGARPADLPVQTPTKYELVINLKTAKALGLAVPPSLLARADEVIE